MKSIDALKSRLTSRNTIVVQNERGFIEEMGFLWKNPVTDEQLIAFEQHSKISLPESYKEFLKISDGATFFEDIKYGQWGCKILSLSELHDISQIVTQWGYELKANWLPFATWIGDCDILAFDLEKANAGEKNYIIDGEQGERVDNWSYIKGDFAVWLDRLIVAQGAKYWRWL